jgi:hypothetical protein
VREEKERKKKAGRRMEGRERRMEERVTPFLPSYLSFLTSLSGGDSGGGK